MLLACAGALAACSSPSSPPLQTSIEHIVREVLPSSIVQINTPTSIGSGVVYDSRGDVVTNAHVVGRARNVQVQRTVGAPLLPARVIGVSVAYDLAVVRVGKGAGTLDPARFANSADVQIGEFVLAMGDPLGLTDSVTQGIVSSASRYIKERGSGYILHAIQTSAEINPGNSGGGLVDLNGEVVGIPTLGGYDPQLHTSAPGIGFAIPSNTVTRVASKLIGAYGR